MLILKRGELDTGHGKEKGEPGEGSRGQRKAGPGLSQGWMPRGVGAGLLHWVE